MGGKTLTRSSLSASTLIGITAIGDYNRGRARKKTEAARGNGSSSEPLTTEPHPRRLGETRCLSGPWWCQVFCGSHRHGGPLRDRASASQCRSDL